MRFFVLINNFMCPIGIFSYSGRFLLLRESVYTLSGLKNVGQGEIEPLALVLSAPRPNQFKNVGQGGIEPLALALLAPRSNHF
jgi:hypothetical protein